MSKILIKIIAIITFRQDYDPNRIHFVYDGVGNKILVYTGIVDESLDGSAKTEYTYDRFGHVLTMTDPANHMVTSLLELRLIRQR